MVKRFLAILFGALLLAGAAMSPASAAAYNWTQQSDCVPTGGPLSPSASPGALFSQCGWTDVIGSLWQTNATNQMFSAFVASNQWQAAQLSAPSGVTGINLRLRNRVVGLAASASASNYSVLRYKNTASVTSGYLCGVTPFVSGSWQMYVAPLINGVIQTPSSRSTNVSVTAGTAYYYDCSIVQVSPTQTQIVATLLASDGTTVLSTETVTDTTAALQNVSGSIAIFETRSSGADTHVVSTELTTYLPGAATTYTVTLPQFAFVGQPTTLSAYANGSLASNVTLTPSASDGGTFSAAVLPSGSNPLITFTYTAAAAGTNTISSTNSGGLTDPSPQTVPTLSPIPVTSPAFHFSPAVWKGDAGRGGSSWRQSSNNGAYVTFVWTASATPTAILLLPSTSTSNRVSYSLNGVITDNVAATGPITITPVASATNTLTVYLRNSTQTNRWGQASGQGNTVQIDGFAIDGGSTAGTAPIPAKGWWWIVGDSITEGILANAGNDDNLYDYSWNVAQALLQQGYDYAISAYGGSGWLHAGDSTLDVPGWNPFVSGVQSCPCRYNLVDSGLSILDSNGHVSAYGSTGTEPVGVLINYGTNEALFSLSTSDMTASITDWLGRIRTEAPAAKVIVLMPFGLQYSGEYSQAYVTALNAGVNNYLAANPNDTNTTELNLGVDLAKTLQVSGSYYLAPASNVHFNQTGYALVAPMVSQAVFSAMAAGGSGSGAVQIGNPGVNTP